MADSEQFLNSVFPEACKRLNIEVQSVDSRGGFLKAATRDGLLIDVFAADLGSVITVTVSLAGTDVIRSMTLDPIQATSPEFVKMHLLEWVLNGGQYAAHAEPHLQGLEPGILTKIDKFLDDKSSSNLRIASRGLKGAIRERPSSRPSQHIVRNSAMSRFVWRQLDIV